MAIVKGEDGFLIFCISAEDKFSDAALQSYEEYVRLLN